MPLFCVWLHICLFGAVPPGFLKGLCYIFVFNSMSFSLVSFFLLLLLRKKFKFLTRVNSEFWISFCLNVALREKEHLSCFARFSFLEGSVCIKRYILVCSEVARLSVTRPRHLFLSLLHLYIRERVVGETVAGLWRLVLMGYTCLLKAPQCVRCEARSLATLCSPHWQYCNSESPLVLLSNSASGTTASHRKDTVLVIWKKYFVYIIALVRGGFSVFLKMNWIQAHTGCTGLKSPKRNI